MLKIALATLAFVAQSLAFAQATPVGLWKTIDDDGKTEKSLVRISESGGDVTDPNNGKVYRAKVRTLEGGKQLQMRGYIGPFFRTQTWIRVE